MRLLKKSVVFALLCGALWVACTPNENRGKEVHTELSFSTDTFVLDTFPEVQPQVVEIVRDSLYEESFDDFLYTFVFDTIYRLRRTRFPLQSISASGDTIAVQQRDFHLDMSFLAQEYHTELYNSQAELECMQSESASDTIVVERVDLDKLVWSAYSFARKRGRWQLYESRNAYLQSSSLSDFLVFYRQFSSDSIFQQSSIAPHLHIRITESEENDNEETIEGTIDASQWFTFSPELPIGVLSNILRGQTFHNPSRIVMQKSGLGDGFAELFTFQKNGGKWMLISYEN